MSPNFITCIKCKYLAITSTIKKGNSKIKDERIIRLSLKKWKLTIYKNTMNSGESREQVVNEFINPVSNVRTLIYLVFLSKGVFCLSFISLLARNKLFS